LERNHRPDATEKSIHAIAIRIPLLVVDSRRIFAMNTTQIPPTIPIMIIEEEIDIAVQISIVSPTSAL
jgi:hypothetical protein